MKDYIINEFMIMPIVYSIGIILFIVFFYIGNRYCKGIVINVLEDLYFAYVLWRDGFLVTDCYYRLLNGSRWSVFEKIIEEAWKHTYKLNLTIDNEACLEYKFLTRMIELLFTGCDDFKEVVKRDGLLLRKIREKMKHDFHFLDINVYKYSGRFNGKHYWKGKLLK